MILGQDSEDKSRRSCGQVVYGVEGKRPQKNEQDWRYYRSEAERY